MVTFRISPRPSTHLWLFACANDALYFRLRKREDPDVNQERGDGRKRSSTLREKIAVCSLCFCFRFRNPGKTFVFEPSTYIWCLF